MTDAEFLGTEFSILRKHTNHKRPNPYGRGLMKKAGLPVGKSKVDTPWFRMHPVLTKIK